MFRPPSKPNEDIGDDENFFVAPPFSGQAGWRANAFKTKPIIPKVFKPIDFDIEKKRINDFQAGSTLVKPKPFQAPRFGYPNLSRAPDTSVTDMISGNFDDNIEASHIGMFVGAVGLATVAAPLLGVGALTIGIPTFLAGAGLIAKNKYDKWHASADLAKQWELQTKQLVTLDPITGEPTRTKSAVPWNMVGMLGSQPKGTAARDAKTFIESLVVGDKMVTWDTPSDRDNISNRLQDGVWQRYLSAEESNKTRGRSLSSAGRTIGRQLTNDLMDDATSLVTLPERFGELISNTANIVREKNEPAWRYWARVSKAVLYSGVPENKEPNAELGKTFLGTVLGTVAYVGQPLARVGGIAAIVSGYGENLGVSPPNADIIYDEALKAAGVDEQTRNKAMFAYQVDPVWNLKLAPYPSILERAGSVLNYAAQNNMEVFNRLPIAAQIGYAFFSPKVAGSTLENVAKALVKAEAKTAAAVGYKGVVPFGTLAEHITPAYWSFTGDRGYDSSMYAKERTSQTIAQNVLTLNQSSLLTPGATPDNIVEKLAGAQDIVSTPTYWRSMRNAIANVPVLSYLSTRTNAAKINLLQKLAADTMVEAFIGVKPNQVRSLFANLVALGDYTPGMDKTKMTSEMKIAVEQLSLWFPPLEIDPLVQKGLNLPFEKGEWWTSTSGLLVRNVLKNFQSLRLDTAFMKRIREFDIGRDALLLLRENPAAENAPSVAAMRKQVEESTGEILRYITKSLYSSTGYAAEKSGPWRYLQSIYAVPQVVANMGAVVRNMTMDGVRLILNEKQAWDLSVKDLDLFGFRPAQAGRGKVIEKVATEQQNVLARTRGIDTPESIFKQLAMREGEVMIPVNKGMTSRAMQWFANLYSEGERVLSERYELQAVKTFLDFHLAQGALTKSAVIQELLSRLPQDMRNQINNHKGVYTAELWEHFVDSFRPKEIAGTLPTSGSFETPPQTSLTRNLWGLISDGVDTNAYDLGVLNQISAELQRAQKYQTSNPTRFKAKVMEILGAYALEQWNWSTLHVKQEAINVLDGLKEGPWKGVFGDELETASRKIVHLGHTLIFDNYLDESAFYLAQQTAIQNFADPTYQRIVEAVKASGMNLDAFLEAGQQMSLRVTDQLPRQFKPKTLQKKVTVATEYFVDKVLSVFDTKIWDDIEEKRVLDDQALAYWENRAYGAVGLFQTNRFTESVGDIYDPVKETFDFTKVSFDGFNRQKSTLTLAEYFEQIAPGVIKDYTQVPRSFVLSSGDKAEQTFLEVASQYIGQLRTDLGKRLSNIKTAAHREEQIHGDWADIFYKAIEDGRESLGDRGPLRGTTLSLQELDRGMRAVYELYTPALTTEWKKMHFAISKLLGSPREFEVQGGKWHDAALNLLLGVGETSAREKERLERMAMRSNTGGALVQQAQLRVSATLDAVLEWLSTVDQKWESYSNFTGNYETQKQILDKISEHGAGVLSQLRTIAKQIGTATRDMALHDYSDKFGIDTVSQIPFGYPYWYLRTWSDWPRQIMEDPHYLASMYRMNNIFKNANEGVDMPEYLRGNVSVMTYGLAEFFGAKTLSFPIQEAFNPLVKLLNGEFATSMKDKSSASFLYDVIYGVGPGPHMGITMLLGLGLLATGDEKLSREAEEFFQYVSPQTRAFSGVIAKAQEHGIVPGTGGATIDPFFHAFAGLSLALPLLSQGMGANLMTSVATGVLALVPSLFGYMQWESSYYQLADGTTVYGGTAYDKKRVAPEIYNLVGTTVNGRKVTPELAASTTAYILRSQQGHRGNDPEFADESNLAKYAITQSRANAAVPAIFSAIGGPGLVVWTDAQIASDKAYKELAEVRDKCETVSAEQCKVLHSEFAATHEGMSLLGFFKGDPKQTLISYAYDVLSRVGPGDNKSVLAVVGLTSDLVSKFYAGKGKVWDTGSDERVFHEGILRLSLVYKGPDLQTRLEWDEAQRLKQKLGQDLDNTYRGSSYLKDAYFKMTGDEKKKFLQENLLLKTRFEKEVELLLNDPIYREKLAPYYLSITEVEEYLKLKFAENSLRGASEKERRFKSVAYQTFISQKDIYTTEQKKLFLKTYGLIQYDIEYQQFKNQLPDMVKALTAGLLLPEPAQMRTDLADPNSAVALGIKESLAKAAEKQNQAVSGRNVFIQDNPNVFKSETAPPDPVARLDLPKPAGPNSGQPRKQGKPLAQEPNYNSLFDAWRNSGESKQRDTTYKPISIDKVVTADDILQNFTEVIASSGAELAEGYVATNQKSFGAAVIDPWLVVPSGQIYDTWRVPFINEWPQIQVAPDAKQAALIAYVKQQGAYSIREAMMKQAISQQVSPEVRHGTWMRVAGTIRELSDTEISQWSSNYPQLLGDLQAVRDMAKNYLFPNMNSYMDVLGIKVTFKEDGSYSIASKVVEKKNPDDVYNSTDVEEYIKTNATEMFGEDIFALYNQYLYLSTEVGKREAEQFWRSDSRIGRYQVFRERIWDNYNDAKNPPAPDKPNKYGGGGGGAKYKSSEPFDAVKSLEDTIRYLDKIKKSVSVANPKQMGFDNSRRVYSNNQRQYNNDRFQPSNVGTRGFPIVPYQSRKAAGSSYMVLLSKLKSGNPMMAGMFQDFMEASPEQRTVILQSNPDLARYLSGITTSDFLRLEDSYRASIITSLSSSKAQPGVVKVYPPVTGRTGL